MAKASNHLLALLLSVACVAVWWGLEAFVPAAPRAAGAAFLVAAAALLVLAVLLLVRRRGWVSWPAVPLAAAFALGILVGLSPVRGFLIGDQPGGSPPAPEPTPDVAASNSARPDPAPDGRFSLSVSVVNPVDLRLPAIEIENRGAVPVDYVVRDYSLELDGRKSFDRFEEVQELAPLASQRLQPKTPARFDREATAVQVIFSWEIGYGPAADRLTNTLFEILRCDVEIDRSAVNAPVGLVGTCDRLFSEDRAATPPAG